MLLTWVHVWANMRALRCLVLSSLNQPRLKLLLQHYMQQVRLTQAGLGGLVVVSEGVDLVTWDVPSLL